MRNSGAAKKEINFRGNYKNAPGQIKFIKNALARSPNLPIREYTSKLTIK